MHTCTEYKHKQRHKHQPRIRFSFHKFVHCLLLQFATRLIGILLMDNVEYAVCLTCCKFVGIHLYFGGCVYPSTWNKETAKNPPIVIHSMVRRQFSVCFISMQMVSITTSFHTLLIGGIFLYFYHKLSDWCHYKNVNRIKMAFAAIFVDVAILIESHSEIVVESHWLASSSSSFWPIGKFNLFLSLNISWLISVKCKSYQATIYIHAFGDCLHFRITDSILRSSFFSILCCCCCWLYSPLANNYVDNG